MTIAPSEDTNSLRPSYKDKPTTTKMKEILSATLQERLRDALYQSEHTSQWTKDIADEIKSKLTACGYARYKYMVQVVIGEQRGEGVRMGSRCFWDSETDCQASETYTNDNLFCVAAAFGENVYDIVIVGGGIVGASLACNLSLDPLFSNRTIGIIESEMPKSLSDDIPDLRSYTLSPRSQNLLEEIGVWKKIKNSRKTSFKYMQVWDGSGDGYVRFDSNLVGSDYLGHVVENDVLQHHLYERMSELTSSPNFRLLCPNKVQRVEKPSFASPWNKLHLDDGRTIESRLIVAADGANSQLRQLCGFETWEWKYNHKAVVATVKTASKHHTAWQKFMNTGPVALLPLRDEYSSIVWSCPPLMADKLVNMDPKEFLHELNSRLLDFSKSSTSANFTCFPFINNTIQEVHNIAMNLMSIGSINNDFQLPPAVTDVVGVRRSFPLRWSNVQCYVQHGIALIGDSAHTIHPLAGQGLNLGMADVIALSKVLSKAAKNGRDIGCLEVLKQYDGDRSLENITMGGAMDCFKRLFEEENNFISFSRNFGLALANSNRYAKTMFMRRAMGI